MEPFIQNHQFNVIKHQAALMQKQVHGTIDREVEMAVRLQAETKIYEAFDQLSDGQRAVLEKLPHLKTEEERTAFLKDLQPFRISFPSLTQKEVKDLFPKTKKLKLPVLSEVDWSSVTYVGWKDIAASRQYIISLIDQRLTGVEGRYVISSKKGICELCSRYGDMAFTSIAKRGYAGENDKAFGKYICYDSKDCNQFIQDPANLTSFIKLAVKEN
ncbi:FusB/FusC family EF-G-binding protein [Jeotgalibacillus proteolyticus]|uniref:FusB/FusC family EF-G-binding protein n=1 Tax=Jeotgalibacillus proteolyticus TaxID=2082395 RepID=UPI003CE6B98B